MSDMEIERGADDHWHFKLGPVERYGVAAAALLLVTSLGWIFDQTLSQLRDQRASIIEQGKQLTSVITQQAVTNAQLSTLNQQLADVPSLTRQMAELKVQVERNSSDIHDLQDRGGHR